MSTITPRNVRPELHQRLRNRAAERGLTLNDYLLDLCRRVAEEPEAIDPWAPLEAARRASRSESG